jgi:excinuclease UvrABC nuclease subunit
MFDGRMEAQPPLDESHLTGIPAKRGDVLLTADRDAPIVMLTAADMRARVRTRLRNPSQQERRKTPDLGEITRRVYWKLCTSAFETDLCYLELAGAIWPGRFAELLSWKPAWFVHVDPGAAFPRFQRTRDVFGRSGRYVGPFSSARSAERFVGLVEDAFDLCRDYRCLIKAPYGQRCTYAEIGKCVSPCDGTIGMDRYRQIVAQAAGVAAGDRQPFTRRLQRKMKAAAGRLEFERAGRIRARLACVEELGTSEYAHVRPAERFRFVCVQRGGGVRRLKVFLADRGRIVAAPPIDHPTKPAQLAVALGAMAELAADEVDCGRMERYRIGLLAHYLFSSARRRGVILPWSEGASLKDLAEAIDRSREALGLRPAKQGGGPRPVEGSRPKPDASEV